MKNASRNLLVITLLLLFSVTALSQESATISLLRPKQSLMSGGAAFTIQVYLNGNRIDDLANGMAINYSLYSEGELEIKLQKEGMGSPHGAPKTIKLDVKNGATYTYAVEAGMNSLKVDELDEKKTAKLLKKTKSFEAKVDLAEDPENPIIK